MWPFDKINCFDHLIAKNETLRIENEKLKKKNKTLSEENQELIKWMRYSRFPFPPKKHYIPEYDGCVDPETNCLKREILFLQTKNEKLDDNLKRARREADCRSHRVKELEHKIGELNTLMEEWEGLHA
jgi:regulator of replication initiation timing